MKLREILITSALAALPLAAQNVIVAPDRPVDTALRTYLTLTDAQISSLQQIQTQQRSAESAIYTQINERQRQLNGLLENNSNDAGTIGRLMVEINNLRRQLPLPGDQYRASALAVLTDEQKAKIPALDQALKLAPAAHEAVFYNLVAQALPGGGIGVPRPLPMPVFLPESATVKSEP